MQVDLREIREAMVCPEKVVPLVPPERLARLESPVCLDLPVSVPPKEDVVKVDVMVKVDPLVPLALLDPPEAAV